MALGIGTYFAIPFEPSATDLAVLACAGVVLGGLALWSARDLRPWSLAGLLVICGLLLAAGRAHVVAEPVLGFRYYGPVEGRIVAIDRSVSDKVRLTLDQVVLADMRSERTPHKVRISLHGDQVLRPEPGLRIMATAHLSPPQGPVEPGGFDFRRMAWFQGLGAVGYTRTPALVAAPAERGGLALSVTRLRIAISQAVQSALPGRTGAFAAAVTTGDRSAMDADTLEALRVTNLAHLLAISGLHMGLLTGFVFTSLRLILSLWPPLALRWPVKKIAAVGAMTAGAIYYALSGGNVATERAFIMTSVLFLAVLLDRRAITLRAVALAATIVLLLRPETLVTPGFQMSFAATTALVAVFAALRGGPVQKLPKWAKPVFALVVSSGVAGLATLPVAAAHFNRIADYGLLANLAAVPLMGLVVVPGAVLAALLVPFGLSWVGLLLMKPGIDWILGVADWVAGLDGAVTPVVAPSWPVLPILALGALWIALWQGQGRWVGLAPMVAAAILWAQAQRPALLVADTGRLMGVIGSEGRALSKAKGDGFSARSWLENDGDGAEAYAAAARPGFTHDPGAVTAHLPGMTVTMLRGRGVLERVGQACDAADIVLLPKRLDAPAPKGCDVYDQQRLWKTGALGLVARDGIWEIQSVSSHTGQRLWSP